MTPEQELMMLKSQQAQGNAVTFQGINKYWPQLVGIVALGWFLVGQGKEQQALMGRVDLLEKNAESVTQVKADQAKTSGEVRELQIAVNNIQASQKEISGQIQAIADDLRAANSQISSIAQAMRSR